MAMAETLLACLSVRPVPHLPRFIFCLGHSAREEKFLWKNPLGTLSVPRALVLERAEDPREPTTAQKASPRHKRTRRK